jgi:peptide/nickel transport system substrate-binding protein
MIRRPKDYSLLIIFSFLIFLPSCIRSCAKADKQNNVINIAVATPPESLDSRYGTSAVASRISDLIYAPLFNIGEDLLPEPFLAESIAALSNKSFKIKLRDNLSFHNGTPLKAQDVVYTYAQLNSPDVASPHAEQFEYIKSIRALNELEIIFELKRPHAPFLTDLCNLGIVSQDSCKDRSQTCRHENNGSGPYKLAHWDKAKESLYLEPFSNWFEGEPKNNLLIRVVRDENTRMLELIGKKTDLIDSDISPINMQQLKKQSHLQISEVPGLGYSYIAFNLRGPRAEDKPGSEEYKTRLALADKRVRKAIAHAIDVDQIIQKILFNTAHRVSGLTPNGHWAKDETLKSPQFDPALAALELDEAGFKIEEPDNMRFKLVIATTTDRTRQSVAQLYVDFLRRVNIDASVRIKDWSALYQDMKQGRFELFSANWVPVMDPDLYYWVHHSASIPHDNKGGGNRHAYINPEVDRLIDMGRSTMEPKKRKAIYQKIERIMLDDMPYVPLWNEHRIVVQNHEKLRGFIPAITGSLLGLRKAYIQNSQALRATN